MKFWMGLAAILVLGMATSPAWAQEHDHAAMAGQTPAVSTVPAQAPMCNCPCMKMHAQGAAAMDHSAMQMGAMDHSATPADHAAMDHGTMQMDHGTMGMMQDKGMMQGMAAMQCPMMAQTPLPAGMLRISFAGKTTDWKLADLAALPHQTVTLPNAHTKTDQTFAGVALMDLLLKAGVPAKLHGKDLALYVAAVGSDGFIAVLSMAEVNPDVHLSTVLVADQLDGKPMTTQGPLMLVVAGETRPARWVRNLVQIKVERAE